MIDAANHPRWLKAIDRAVVELVSNPWIERGDHGLIIASTSGNVYSANGVCQCKAYEHGNACWHRAASRLVRLHDERQFNQCPNCCAGETYANRCPAAQIAADQVDRQAAYVLAKVAIDELFA